MRRTIIDSPAITQFVQDESQNHPGHLRPMAQTLSAAQQTQLENRDGKGQFKSKTHGEVDDDADVLGLTAQTEAQQLAESYVEDEQLTESFERFSTHFDDDMVATARLYARRRLASRGDMTDPMHDADDLAQDSLVKALEQIRKKGADSIDTPRSWLNKTMKHTSNRMGEGKYHWPNSVALRIYNEKIAEKEQQQGQLMTRRQKTQLRDEIVENWDEVGPDTMKRHRPQPDFDRHTTKNTAIRLDRFDAEATGTPHGSDAFLAANHTTAQRDEGLDHLTETLSGANTDATVEQKRAASAAGWAMVSAEHNAPPVAEGGVSPDYAREYERSFGEDGSGVVDAIEAWEAGEEDASTAAIFAPFRRRGTGGLSRSEESSVVDALTAHGKTGDKAGRLWKLALDGARRDEK